MASEFFPISWGKISLWAARVSTDNSRRQTIHELTRGDFHPVEDRGMKPRTTTMELLFDDFPGERESPMARFRKLKAEVDAGTRAIFTHPIEGGYLAKVGDFTYDWDASFTTVTNVAIQFIADEVIDPISPAGAGAINVTGESSIDAAAANLSSKLTEAELEWLTSDDEALTDVATTAAEAWQEGDSVPTRQIIVDTSEIVASVDDMITTLALEDDLALFEVYRASILFADAVRQGAIAATAETPSYFVMRIATPCALLPLCARTYGGNEAEDRARQVSEMNDVRTPGWLDVGQYLFPSRSSSGVFV